ncbi:MAG TPA: UDP-glucose 4-epimerase GalE [Alphaproteobacteria bacterium]|nr:UDP-glucose 4-epimerase GalE [Alphaproteobacteria bacterium]
MSLDILVTGGAGYVGSHAVQELIDHGHRVVVIDNLQQGHREAVPGGAPLLEGDLADRAFVADVFRRHRFDAVMHFAANSLVGESMREPFKYLRDNVMNGLNLIEAAAQAGIKKFVLSSTANVYGRPEIVPIPEASTIDPGSPYGESKLMIERALAWADTVYGMRSASLRYFNAAGAHPNGRLGEDHDPETHLIPIVLDAALGRRSHVEIFGDDYPTPDGTCIRDYVHVCDLAQAHLRVLDTLDERSCIFNVGTGTGQSVRTIIAAAERVTGIEIPVRIGPRRAGDPAVLVAASDAIGAQIGWKPRFTDIDEIIRSAWQWRRRHPNGYATAAAAAVAE